MSTSQLLKSCNYVRMVCVLVLDELVANVVPIKTHFTWACVCVCVVEQDRECEQTCSPLIMSGRSLIEFIDNPIHLVEVLEMI